MVNNMGIADRVIRVLLAIVVGILCVTGTIAGAAAAILGVVAVVFFLTSVISFCPAYLPFKIHTAKRK
ncbi:MAG: DUF2892 domain-containing protein [Planctomycetota bacterium]